MGFTVVLNTRQELHPRVWLRHIPPKRVVTNAANILWIYLSDKWQDPSSPCLRFTNPYSQTVFNRLQMSVFLPEWRAMSQAVSILTHRQMLAQVETLAQQCHDETGFYLRFVGD